jgi:NADPH:quinone reductase-like Zn-dependent oxidoreductase
MQTTLSAAYLNAAGIFYIVALKCDQLSEISRLIDVGKPRPLVAAAYPLEQAREAYARAKAGHLRGKVVLSVAG